MKRGKILIIFLILIFLASTLALAEQQNPPACDDEDGDGYGVGDTSSCANPEQDCNNNNPNINPGAVEVANGLDDNCNGEIDEGLAFACTDSDLDGYNTSMEHPIFCPGGTCCAASQEEVDCDDSHALVNPGMDEIYGDGLDNDCNPYTSDDYPVGEGYSETSGCQITDLFWADCDGNEIFDADEGDSVYLIVVTEDCSDESVVDFTIKEDNTDGDIDVLTEEYFLNLEDTDINAWAVGWISLWLDDGTSDPDPEYYFKAKVITPEEGSFESESNLLTIMQCPDTNPDCGEECTLADQFIYIGPRGSRDGGGSGGPVINQPESCMPQWDCSDAEWSECNTRTGKVTRDVSLCVFTGTGDEECIEGSRASLVSSKACSSHDLKQKSQVYVSEEKDEIEEESGFPWFWIIMIGLLMILIVGAVFYYLKFGGKGKMPFASSKDFKAVVDYIKLARSKGLKDLQIKAMLKKSGWKDAQVKYAFEKAPLKKQ
ncbi:MAG: putative metal-binding motif-containing protein [Nanoarchaeota archaeon]|nr:putative metal-binding motif-containing protein [Nanoarchaeota archaeon]